MNPIGYRSSRLSVALVMVAGLALVGMAGCGSSSSAPRVEVGSPDADTGGDSATDAAACPASCDDNNDCTIDSCDPNTYQCVHAPVADGTSCEDGNTCTINDLCQGGTCFSGQYKTCPATDQCHAAGVCTPKTGECSNPNAPNGKACDDGLKCTTGDQCMSGVCSGTPACSGSATCDPATGACGDPGRPVFPTALSSQIFEDVFGSTSSNGLVRAPDGSIFMAGSFKGTTDLGTGPITAYPDTETDLFIAQLDPSTGKSIGTQTFLGVQAQDVRAFAVNGNGQLGLVGNFLGSLTVGGIEVDARTAAGQQFILLASSSATDGLVPSLLQVNLLRAFSSQETGLRGIAGDPLGSDFVLCGTANKAATDLAPSLAWQGGLDVVLARLDGLTGTIIWAQQVGGYNDEKCAGVVMDQNSNIYVLGTYQFGSVVNFGGAASLPMVDDPKAVRMFLAKLDSSGQAVWARDLGTGPQTIVPTAMLALGTDVLVAGTIQSGALSIADDMNPGEPTVNLGGAATFVGRFSGTTGVLLWIKGLGTATNLTVTAMAEGADDGALLTGSYLAALALGTTAFPQPYAVGGGTFVAQMNGDGAILAAKGYGDPTSGNQPVGVIRRTDGTGDEKNSSLLLTSFLGKLNLGPAVGALDASSPTTPAICVAKLAP